MAQILTKETVDTELFKKSGAVRVGRGFGSAKFGDIEKLIEEDIRSGISATKTAEWVIKELTDKHGMSREKAGKKGAALYTKAMSRIDADNEAGSK